MFASRAATVKTICRKAFQTRYMGGGPKPEWQGFDKKVRAVFPEDWQREYYANWSCVIETPHSLYIILTFSVYSCWCHSIRIHLFILCIQTCFRRKEKGRTGQGSRCVVRCCCNNRWSTRSQYPRIWKVYWIRCFRKDDGKWRTITCLGCGE